MIIKINRRKNPFAQIDKGILQDRRLSYKAREPEALYRHIIAYHLARAGYSRHSIGRMMGRDHSTVTSSIRKYEQLQCWPAFRAWAEACREAVGEAENAEI